MNSNKLIEEIYGDCLINNIDNIIQILIKYCGIMDILFNKVSKNKFKIYIISFNIEIYSSIISYGLSF